MTGTHTRGFLPGWRQASVHSASFLFYIYEYETRRREPGGKKAENYRNAEVCTGIHRKVNNHRENVDNRSKRSFGRGFWTGLTVFMVFTILCATYLSRELSEEKEICWKLFVLFGFALPHILPRRHRVLVTVLVGCLLSVPIEVLQYVAGTGLRELDDVFHNMLGSALGAWISWKCMEMK